MKLLTALAASSLLLLCSFQQTPGATPQPTEPQESEFFRLQRELETWRAAHGASWRATFDRETGYARFLWGGARALGFAPQTDAEHVAAARQAIDETRAMHGIDPATLRDDGVTFLPLSLAGSTDKISVQFRQQVGGVPVVHGFVNVLFDRAGRVLAVDATASPFVRQDFEVVSAFAADEVIATAASIFQRDHGLIPTRITRPELVIAQVAPIKLREARLAWQLEVHFSEPGSEAEGFLYRFDARTGALLERIDAVHNDVSGTVVSRATPGLAPDAASNPETLQNMPYIRVTSAQGTATADANGNFTIVGATAPVSVTVDYFGPWCNSNNQGGSSYTLTTTLNAASGNTITMNPASAAFTTAEANAFLWINKLRDWTRSVNPTDATSDFQAISNPNINLTCNAYYDGVSVNFYQTGGGCVNTAYSTVALHEMGHWMNTLYQSGNGPDGFGEGNADVFSMYLTEDPVIGLNFCGTGCNIRTGTNTRQFCGDANPGCHGGVHANGEVLGGALWKVRTRLKNALGASLGAQTANTLFNAWMNAYNDGQIKTIIEEHWLVLDDDNGNIDDGTPNFTHIDNGFKDQGFPGYSFKPVSFGLSSVTQLSDTQDQTGPYVVDAVIYANVNPPIASATVRYRVNGGAFSNAAMSVLSGNTWRGNIPGIQSPAKVDYYVTATDSLGNTNVFPSNAPTGVLKFKVGQEVAHYSEGFESGASGWTHQQIATQDDWQLSSEQGGVGAAGKSGDPSAAYAGQNIWGNDLGFANFNGAYNNNVSNRLRSPTINMSGKTGLYLELKRWLTVESGQYDQAIIRVNGQQVWINDTFVDHVDTSWTEMEVDISSIADNNASVQLEFALVSDGGLVYGGWNIDEVKIVSLGAVCGAPTATKPNDAQSCPGSGVAFSTTAGGVGPFTYQWEKNGAPIGGATSSSYSIASVASGDAGSYTCVVGNACASTESAAGVLTVNVATSSSSPANQTACPGGSASFATTASGTGPFSYQWKKNGVAIGGATASSLALSNVQAGDAGAYTVVVTGACGSVEPGATLTVDAIATATTPTSQAVCPGAGVSFSTSAGGTGPFTYQWKKDGVAIGGATASSLVLSNVQAGDAGAYSVVVTGACGSVEPSATLTVHAAVGATTPSSQTACEGTGASFSTSASGTGPFTYQWKKDGVAIGGATSSSLVLSNVQAGDAGTYSVLVTGACGSVEPSATLAVDAATTATTPSSAVACPGGGASFGTTAGGTGPFTYQWKKDGVAIGGATSSSLVLSNVQASDAGAYSVLVTGSCGSVEPSATLTVNVAVSSTTPASQSVCEGASASFSTTASGTGPFAYQWKKNGVAIPGETASSLVLAAVLASDAGSYSVAVTGACGVVEPSATLSVLGVVTTYCTSKQNSVGGFPQIGHTGEPSATANDFVLTLSSALPNKNALGFWGVQPSGAPFNGGFLCIQPPLHRLTVTSTDAGGAATTAIPIDGSMIGTTRYYQWWSRDPQDPFTVSLSGGLSVLFCD